MPPATPPPVSAEQVRRLVGDSTLRKGGTYARKESAYDLSWNARFTELTGKVEGSRSASYRTTVKFSNSDHAPGPLYGICTCPMRSNCKHVAALLLTHAAEHKSPPRKKPAAQPGKQLKTAKRRAAEAPSSSGWERQLEALVKPPTTTAAAPYSASGYVPGRGGPAFPLALQFELRDEPDYAAKYSHRTSSAPRTVNLCVKPVFRSAAGNWIAGQLRWEKFQAGYYPGEFDEAHWDWMCTFAAVSRRTSGYSSYGNAVKLNDFRSPLLWDLLKRAPGAGVKLIGRRHHAGGDAGCGDGPARRAL